MQLILLLLIGVRRKLTCVLRLELLLYVISIMSRQLLLLFRLLRMREIIHKLRAVKRFQISLLLLRVNVKKVNRYLQIRRRPNFRRLLRRTRQISSRVILIRRRILVVLLFVLVEVVLILFFCLILFRNLVISRRRRVRRMVLRERYVRRVMILSNRLILILLLLFRVLRRVRLLVSLILFLWIARCLSWDRWEVLRRLFRLRVLLERLVLPRGLRLVSLINRRVSRDRRLLPLKQGYW